MVIAASAARPVAACGEFNGDGSWNIADVTSAMDYIIRSGPPPVNFDSAEFDGARFLSIVDVQRMTICVFMCDIPPFGTCPSVGPPIAPVVDSTVKFHYPNRIPAGVTSFDMSLTLIDAPRIDAFLIPLTILVNGSPANVDSITFPAPGSIFEQSLPMSSITGPGEVRMGLATIFSKSPVKGDVPAIVHLSVPLSPTQSALEVNWATLSPVNAPTPDSSVYPLFYRQTVDPYFVPALVGSCCIVPGDSNGDGSFNIADVTFMIARIFTGGAAPPCTNSSDANADGVTNIADMTYGIARIFSGGPAPICGP